VLYSSLAAYSLFKVGRGGQAAVDALLAIEDPTLQYVPQPAPRTQLETVLTQARNRFVHAEERGNDPLAAMRQMSTLLGHFKALAASIIARG
jgi:hypothetical protein